MALGRVWARRAFQASLLCMLAVAGCAHATEPLIAPGAPPATLIPTRAATPIATETSEADPQAVDTGWMPGDPGVELRHTAAPAGESRVPVVIVRLDPQLVRVRVAYRPEKPLALRAWFAAERPLLAINAGYFAEDHRSTALVISDGVASGASYEGFGGMFAVHADGTVELRPLRDVPYDAAENIVQATQSSPMLVFPGGVGAELRDDGERARRSVVAFDQAGRILLLVAPTSALTLSELAQWLVSSDLQIDRALNLDGGSSTGLFVASGALSESIDSFAGLPIVILINR